jgi:hypothetical protein
MLFTCEQVGIYDPAMKMLLIRLLHALFAALCVWFGYQIIRKMYSEKAAEISGWLLALFWMFPMLSVRNLVEMACIPPLMASIWLVVKKDENYWFYLLAGGLLAGLAFCIRFQTGFFILGAGIAIWMIRGFVPAIWYALGTLITIVVFQGVTDIVVWGYPFAEIRGYAAYNLQHSGDYPNGPWYNYILLIIGLLIPPAGFFLLTGFFKEWKKGLLIFLPVALFFLFHSYFPNKQERFILPILPFVIMLGSAGWLQIYTQSAYWMKHRNLHKGLLYVSLGLNMILLLMLSFSSTKKNRVDAMIYLSRYRHISCYAVENSNHENGIVMPKFYLEKQWPDQFNILSDTDFEQMKTEIDSGSKCKPQFILFMEEENLSVRVERLKKLFPALTYETTIYPSFIDVVMHTLNPVNVNQVTLIYNTGIK